MIRVAVFNVYIFPCKNKFDMKTKFHAITFDKTKLEALTEVKSNKSQILLRTYG